MKVMQIIAYLLAAVLMFVSGVRAQEPVISEADAANARSATKAIWAAAQNYANDKGDWPTTVEELLKGKYLDLPDIVLSHWRFMIRRDPSVIRAFFADPNPTRDVVYGLDYTIATDHWSNFGLPDHKSATLTPDQQADLAHDAIGAVHALWETAQVYQQDKGIWPASPDILAQEHYIELPAGLRHNWQFGFVGTPPETIVAVSTSEMTDGGGRTILFDVIQNKWQGYGLAKLKAALENASIIHVEYMPPPTKAK
jgi:hypothetical protein